MDQVCGGQGFRDLRAPPADRAGAGDGVGEDAEAAEEGAVEVYGGPVRAGGFAEEDEVRAGCGDVFFSLERKRRAAADCREGLVGREEEALGGAGGG